MKLPKITCPHCAEAIPPEFVFESVARLIKAARLPHAAQAPAFASPFELALPWFGSALANHSSQIALCEEANF